MIENNIVTLASVTMSGDNIATLITAIAALVTAIVTLFIAARTRRFNYNQLFAQTVSQSRNVWLTQMREYISKMLAVAQTTKDIYEYYKVRNEIMLRLNLAEAYHIELKQQIERLDNFIYIDESTITAICNRIIEISRQMLKEEWEKVKKEAKGEEKQ